MERTVETITDIRGCKPLIWGFNFRSKGIDSAAKDVKEWFQDVDNPADMVACLESCRGFEWHSVISMDQTMTSNAGSQANIGMRAMAKLVTIRTIF